MLWRAGAICAGLAAFGCAQAHPPGDDGADQSGAREASTATPGMSTDAATPASTARARGEKVEVDPGLRHVMVARRDASGRIVMECVTQGHLHEPRRSRAPELK